MDTLGDKGKEKPPPLTAGRKLMNTTKLIAHWTMSGEGIGALIADNQPTPEPTAATNSFLIKGANEGSWQSLDA